MSEDASGPEGKTGNAGKGGKEGEGSYFWEMVAVDQVKDAEGMIEVDEVYRAKVPGGWLVYNKSIEIHSVHQQQVSVSVVGHGRVQTSSPAPASDTRRFHRIISSGMCFMPDPQHVWTVTALP
tara:strand:- start:4435 stop:4803 length:369 start_codon:yes stop_codon:yes gene_type:complete